MINVCIPCVKRYDLLRGLLASLNESTVKPTVYVIDNGRDSKKLAEAIVAFHGTVHVFRPSVPLGVAQSWNRFIADVPEDRVIANDDVLFAPKSLELLAASDADLIFAKGCGFSCFLLRDRGLEQVGFFDDTISPGYGYYEDEDYLQRIDGHGTREPIIRLADVDCGVRHLKSQTLAASTEWELAEHYRKFKIAQQNYITKWSLSDVFEREAMQKSLAEQEAQVQL
jgi:GT2 family glycosyltransferase